MKDSRQECFLAGKEGVEHKLSYHLKEGVSWEPQADKLRSAERDIMLDGVSANWAPERGGGCWRRRESAHRRHEEKRHIFS